MPFNGARDDEDAVYVAEDEVAGFDEHTTDLDGAAKIDDARAHAGVLREAAAAEDGPVLFEHARRVAMEAVNDSARASTSPCSGGEDFAPGGAVHGAASGEVDLAGLDAVESVGEAAKGTRLRAGDIGDLHGKGAPDDAVHRRNRLDGLRQELVPAALAVENIAKHGREQALANEGEEFGVRQVLHGVRFGRSGCCR